MRNHSLAFITVIALCVNAVGVGLTPLSAAAAPVPDRSPASFGALPAWFAATPDDQYEIADQETTTDGEGWYRFEGLPHGTHKVTLDPASLPASLRPAEGEPVPVLWITPGQELTSDPLSTGVRLTAIYDRESGDISGLVFLDLDGDGWPGPDEPGLFGVRVLDPTLHQYFVPFDDRDLWTLFQEKASCHGSNNLACGPLLSFIHIAASSDGTVYYYDHWEDGYDADPLDPGSTTEVGTLDTGGHQLFESSIDPNTTPWPPPAPPYYYDGRDRITIFGEPAAVVRLARPASYAINGSCPGASGTTGWLAGAWGVPEVANWGTEYVATVGEDLDYSGGTPDDHDYAGLEVMAGLDGTDVYYNGTWVDNLDAGEVYFVDGANDGPGGGGVDSDDTITASAPIQAQMVTGACSTLPDEFVSAHGYTLQPLNRWDSAYWAPVPGFTQSCNPDNSNVDTDIYLHNPHSYPIIVTVSSDANTADVGIPANTSTSVLYETGWVDISIGNQGVYLSSSEVFWGMAVIDSSTNGATAADNYDWGYSLLPESILTSQAMICYGPGNADDPPTDNGNLAFVTAITDTVIYVDLNQDDLPDPFDMNGNGNATDYNVWGVPGWDEPLSALGIPLQARQVLRVGDPDDRSLRGALIYTTDLEERIAVAWGQDPCRASLSDPYLDQGYAVLPSPIPALSKMDDLAIDADSSGGVSPGDTITYTLVLHNNGHGPMSDVMLTDYLPYTYTDFVVGSLQVTTPPPTDTIAYSNDGVSFGDPENPDIQAFRVTWPSIGPDVTVTTTFRVRLHTHIPVTVTEISNQAVVESSNTDPCTAEVTTPLQTTADLAILKTDDPDPVIPGSLLTYTLEVINNGPNDAENAVVTDTLPPEVTFVDADPLQDSGPNPLVWNLGRMAAGETQFITVVVQVQSWVTQTFTNTASVDSDTPDPNPDNNHDEETTRPMMPGLELIKTVEPSRTVPDMPFTYTLRIINTGYFTFTALRLTDTLPTADFHYVVGSGSPVDPDIIAEPLLEWFDLVPIAGPLVPGASLTVTFQVTTPLTDGTYTNTATVEGVYPGGTLTDTDDAPVVITDPAVAVDKRIFWMDQDPVAPNYVTFTIAITNVGPSTIDVLPLRDQYDTDYLSFVDATPYPEEDADDGLLTWYDLTGPAPHGLGRDLPTTESFVVTTVFLIVRATEATTNTAIVTDAIDVYGNLADEARDDASIGTDPMVKLLYFRAVAEEAAVRLEWATAAEVDCVGFRVYRDLGANFDGAQAIAYVHATGPGSTYSHVDRDVTPDQVYWYWLAEVSTDGDEIFYGPVWGGVGLNALPVRLYLPLIQRGWK